MSLPSVPDTEGQVESEALPDVSVCVLSLPFT